MSDSPVLSSEAVEFLLELLELPEPLLSCAMAELCSSQTAQLVAAGLLVPHDHETVAVSMADHDDAPVSLAWSEKAGSLTYFSPSVGPVLVPADQLLRRRVDINSALAAITADLDLPRGRPPFELLDGLLWEIGDARFGRRPARVPMWLSRRLWDRAVLRQVSEAARARPHPRQRVILTSTRPARARNVVIPGAIVVSLRDVLARPEGLAVSADILDARLSGVPARPDAGPIALSPDGRQLTINGGSAILFKSAPQIAAIQRLVAAYQAGERVPIGQLSGNGSLNRLFGAKKWALLSPYLSSVNGLWGFEP